MRRLILTLFGAWVGMVTTFAVAQEDNGNNFEMSWSADFSVFKGDQGKGLTAFAPADIDQDGHKEFFVYDKVFGIPSFDRLLCFEAAGNDSFELVWSQEYDRWADDEGHGLTVADLDNDDKDELIVAAQTNIFIYEWDGTTFESGGGLPQEPTATIDPLFDNSGNAWIRLIHVGNLDPDPVDEMFLGYFGESGLYSVIMSLPSQDFSVADWKFEFADDFTPWRCGGIAIADFDGDGGIDFWTSHFNDLAATRVYENVGVDNYEITYTTLPEELVLDPPYDSTIANAIFHDFDGDGQGELLIMDSHGYMYIITKESSNDFTDFGSSAYNFVTRFPLPEPHAGFMRSGFMGDLDLDGKPDIYYNVNKLEAVLDLEYQGGPILDESSWIKYQIYKGHKLVFGHIQPAGDLDGDGRGEIVIAGNGDEVANLQIIENQDAVTHVESPETVVPSHFTLYQNVPNPFNAGTSIRFDLKRDSHVSLTIHDLLGQKVRGLISGERMAGSHNVTWDGLDDSGIHVGSGQYFLTLRSAGLQATRKLTLIK